MYENLTSARQDLATDSLSAFQGTFLRPNLGSNGTVPAREPFSDSPDIWIGGTRPIANFKKTLASAESYVKQSPNSLTVNQSNYIYVRGKNGAKTPQSHSVQLYYAASSVIPWPGQWVNNVIPTDQGNPMAFITNLKAGAVGVADQTFLWQQVPPVPSGSDHYCLFAQLNDDRNANPFPKIFTQIDMAELVKNNLGWGWRNTRLIAGERVDHSYNQALTIPADIEPGTTKYFVYLLPVGFVGWRVWFTCSQTDVRGHAIAEEPTTIDHDGQIIGTTAHLKPGFNAVVTVYLDSNGHRAKAGATMPLKCSYETSGDEAVEAFRRGLVDVEHDARMRTAIEGIGPTPLLVLGSNPYTAMSV
jgi:hypothetical protein